MKSVCAETCLLVGFAAGRDGGMYMVPRHLCYDYTRLPRNLDR
jgi:hypothetical protein